MLSPVERALPTERLSRHEPMIFVHRSLPPLPRITLSVLPEAHEDFSKRFLVPRRLRLSAGLPDGTQTDAFHYDMVDRERLDAVVIAPHFIADTGELCVVLRSAIRPPVYFRRPEACPFPEQPTLGNLWEVPAGLVEADERSSEGLRQCASRELYEEVGAKLPFTSMEPLGGSTFPCPGVIGERHFYFHARIDPHGTVAPPEDGSHLEKQAKIIAVPLLILLELVNEGQLEDAKTEIALRRLSGLGLS